MNRRLVACCAGLAMALGFAPSALAADDSYVDVIVALDRDHAAGNHRGNKDRAAAVASAHGIAAIHTYGSALFGFAATVPQGRLNGLRNDPRVDYVDDDGEVRAFGETAPWGVGRIGLESVDRASTNTGAGVHVYVLDTGIDADHGDLAANLGNGYAVESCRGGGCLAAWDDDHGHGTHVAGTVGAVDNDQDVIGVAPGVTLHAVKVLDANGSGTRSGVIAGIDWVANEVAVRGQAAVANMSLGGSGSKKSNCSASGFSGSDAYHQSICTATRSGTVFAVAAGNSDVDAAGAVPAAYDDAVITVSAVQQGDDWPYWSNWGDDAATWTKVASAPVTVSAPGGSVISTRRGGGTTSMSGTSMAAPHVAGGLALYLHANAQAPDYRAFVNARTAMLSEAEPTSGWSNTSGNAHAEPFLDVRTWAPLTTVTEPVTDAPPVVTITSPTAGATVGGEAVNIAVDATDSEGVSTVEFFLDEAAAPFATDNDGTNGWSASWNTTQAQDGTHTVTVRATEQGESPQSASASVAVTVDNAGTVSEPAPATITLSADGYKVKGSKHADLTWSGATSDTVDVYVDGNNAGTTANDQAATVNLHSKGGGTHTFKICESGTTVCSSAVSVSY